MSIPIRLAADIGGTFTDVVLESEAGFQSTKVLTTLNQPEIGVMQGIDELLRLSNIEPGQITHVIHGTTLGTNTVIERKGAKTAFLTTEENQGLPCQPGSLWKRFQGSRAILRRFESCQYNH